MVDSPNLPYVLTTGRITPLLQKIQEAQTPLRFTQDFLDTKLGMKGGSAAPLIPLLKRIGFLENDSTPTDLCRKYRNPDTSGPALAQGIRKGYSELFSRNEYAHSLSRDKLANLIVEITGKEKDDRVVGAIVATFWVLKEKADFERVLAANDRDKKDQELSNPPVLTEVPRIPPIQNLPQGNGLGLNLSYTINLNLPETDDINVYNAIFKSLRENMLKG
jgi:hypothetical protein